MRFHCGFFYKHKKLAIIGVSFVFGLNSGSVSAYPQVEFQSCITNAINATMVKGLDTTIKKIERYCDCSLKKIVDEGKDVRKSLDYCNALYFQ